MTDDRVEGMLRGRHVLLVHDEAFLGLYLADVIRRSGGIVIGPVASGIDGAALLDSDPPPVALVLSDTVPDCDLVARVAGDRRLAMLIVRSPRAAPPPLVTTARVLTAPFAGFQVVEIVADLLGEAGAHRIVQSGPRRCGH